MKISYLGTTVLLFDDGADQVMFDAHITRPAIYKMVLGRVRTDEKTADRLIDKFKIDRLRAVFISHSHFDHVMDVPYFANKCGADIYGSPSALNVARGGDVPEERLFSYNESMEWKIGSFEIRVIPSIHSKPTVFNNDLGQTIDKPLRQPARLRDYKEGGSYDFFVKNGSDTYIIRPSCNYIEGQLNGLKAETLFLGISGITKMSAADKRNFFSETIDKTEPGLVIPIHWDNFFRPLCKPIKGMPLFIEDTDKAIDELKLYCGSRKIHCKVLGVQKSLERE